MRRILMLVSLVALLGLGTAWGQTIDDPLHAFCWGTSSCSDNGTNTPTSTNPPEFGFTVSPGPQTSDFLVEVLVPTSAGDALSFTITGTQGGAANNQSISGNSTLFSTTPWSSGDLAGYLGLNASPANPIGAYLAGGSSYYVYQVDLGTNQLYDNPGWASGPLLSINALPTDTYIVGFLDPPKAAWIATANSGALLETGPPSQVPEPGTLTLLGTGLLSLAGMIRRRRNKKA